MTAHIIAPGMLNLDTLPPTKPNAPGARLSADAGCVPQSFPLSCNSKREPSADDADNLM